MQNKWASTHVLYGYTNAGITLGFLIHHLDERLDVAKAIGKSLLSSRVPIDAGDVVGHQHAVISHLFVGTNSADKIYVAVVGKGLLKVEKAALDIAEVHVKNFIAGAEIADYVINLFIGVLEALTNRPLAKIKSVIGAGA